MPPVKIDLVRIGRIILCLILFLSASSTFAFAERPFIVTERALPLERGRYRFDGGMEIMRFSASKGRTVFSTSLKYGQIQNLEFGVLTSYIFGKDNQDHFSQLGDLFLTTKIRFLKGRAANPLSISGKTFIKLPTAGYNASSNTSGQADVGFVAIASKTFTSVTTHLNFGYVFIGKSPREVSPQKDTVLSSLGFDFKTSERLVDLVCEIFGQIDRGSAISNGRWSILFGGAYQAEPDIYLDTGFQFSLNHNMPDRSFHIGITHFFS